VGATRLRWGLAPFLVAGLGLAGLGLAACGGSKAATKQTVTTPAGRTSSSSSASTSTSSPTSTMTRAGSSTTTRTSQLSTGPPLGSQPAGGPVPAGFDPISFTAVSAQEFWLLGDAPCGNPVCTSIVRTTDGGATFVGLPAPTSLLDLGGQGQGRVNALSFVDPLDGYVYDTNAGGAFWDTHDGGEHWSQPGFLAGRELLAFGTGGAYAFALVGKCANGSCTDVVLERSPVSSDSWSPTGVQVPAGVGPVVAMTVRGPRLWLSLTTSQSQPNQLLVVADGFGASYATYKSPCYQGLGGSLAATSSQVVWAVCPTGMLAGLWRSANGGTTWEQLTSVGQLPNSAILAPASDTRAVVGPNPQGDLLVTGNAGATWAAVQAGTPGYSWSWVGFLDPNTGAALRLGSPPPGWPWPNGPGPEQLWLTNDGGATWSGPVRIG
jgi:photosystem II stability/assembly factor-like uncharacterized protein